MDRTCFAESASAKAQTLLQAECTFSEFGTRRRRSFHAQDLVIATLKQEANRYSGRGAFFGTSNVCILFQHSFIIFHKLILNPQRPTLQRNMASTRWEPSRSTSFVYSMIQCAYEHDTSEWFMGVSTCDIALVVEGDTLPRLQR